MNQTFNLGDKGKKLIKEFEGCKLTAYLCPANIPTIGYGNTFYLNKDKVKIGDKITLEKADELFNAVAQEFVDCVNELVKSTINQNQFDALVSLCYNIGQGNFHKSTVLKKVNLNPSDPSISDSFMMWNKANSKVLVGLTKRRIAEGNLYFTK